MTDISVVSDQTDPAPTTLGVVTMEDAIRRALARSPAIGASVARLRAAEAEADQVRLLPNPIMTVVFRFPSGGDRPVIEAGVAGDLLAILKRPGRIQATDDRLRAAASDVLTNALDVVVDVQEEYISLQSLDAIVPVLEQRKSLIDHLLEVADARLRQGEGTSLDTTTLTSQRLELEVEGAEQQQNRQRVELALSRLIGEQPANTKWTPTPWQQPGSMRGTESEWVQTALTNRPEIAAHLWELSALGVEVRLTRLFPFDNLEAGLDSERDDVWTVGPALSTPLPIFDWGGAAKAKAMALRQEARQKLIATQRQVVQEVRTSYRDFASSSTVLELIKTQLLPSEERRRSQTEAAYRAGQTDITAVIIADQDLQAARAKLIESEQKTATALVRLERSVGGAGIAASVTQTSTTRPTVER